MNVIELTIIDALHFRAVAPCGEGWVGMRHSDDVRIVLDRAMDHVKTCTRSAQNRDAMIESDR